MFDLEAASARLRSAIDDAGRGLVEREVLLELVVLAAVAREHVLVVGPPGTAKSEAVRRVARGLGGRYFEYLLGRFTEPSEIFGPVDLRRLKEGVVETQIEGMLPEAEIAFLDEVFLGSTAILNALLALLNERRFRRGHTDIACPLRICVGASNQLPEDEQLAAFADRFLVRVFVEPIEENLVENLLEGGWSLGSRASSKTSSIADLDVLAETARRADLAKVRPVVAHALRLLRRAGIALSDRRMVKLQSLVAAAAALGGRAEPTEADLWPLISVVPTREAQALARDVLREVLAPSRSDALSAAAASASLGPAARAAQIERSGRALLGEEEAMGDGPERAVWLLKLEALARTMDAAFTKETLPPELGAIRDRILALVAAA